jgi:predicted nucleotidyltransferase
MRATPLWRVSGLRVLFRVARFGLKCSIAAVPTEIGAMSLREELHHNRDAVDAIAVKHGASNVRLFGSVIRGDEGPDSDIDLLIDMDENRGFADYLALVEELEGLFGRHVDLVIGRSLSPHFRPYIEAEARPL